MLKIKMGSLRLFTQGDFLVVFLKDTDLNCKGVANLKAVCTRKF